MASLDVSSQDNAARKTGARIPWTAIAWFGALLILAYAPVLARLGRQWMSDDNMGHGFFVPLAAAYIAWGKREELLAAPVAGNWWGLLVVGYAALQLLVANLGAELFLARTAFVFSVIGTILLLGGTRVLRLLAFPLFLLFFMVPLPAVIFNEITLPLQFLASEVAEKSLSLLGIPVLREGNILELPSQSLSVVEACSGIRSLLSLSFLALIYGHLFDRKPWMKFVLLAASVPIAIVANASRVTLTGIVSEYKREWAEGFLHFAEGWIIFLAALILLTLAHRVINQVYSFTRAK